MKNFERLFDKDTSPTNKIIEQTIGKKTYSLWSQLREYLKKAYEIKPDLLFYGEKYGWCFKYRKSSKTLCTLFPEKNSFTVLITLGKKELDNLKPFSNLSTKTKKLIKKTHQYHDGKWLWIRIPNLSNLKDIKTILHVKRKPKLK